MARSRIWRMGPGETRDLGVSFDSELDADASLTGATPVISAWTGNDDVGFTAAAGFAFAQQQVNASDQVADDGEVIAAGRGAFFRVTAPTTRGRYVIRSECDADDGTHPVRPGDVMIVEGADEPA